MKNLGKRVYRAKKIKGGGANARLPPPQFAHAHIIIFIFKYKIYEACVYWLV